MRIDMCRFSGNPICSLAIYNGRKYIGQVKEFAKNRMTNVTIQSCTVVF